MKALDNMELISNSFSVSIIHTQTYASAFRMTFISISKSRLIRCHWMKWITMNTDNLKTQISVRKTYQKIPLRKRKRRGLYSRSKKRTGRSERKGILKRRNERGLLDCFTNLNTTRNLRHQKTTNGCMDFSRFVCVPCVYVCHGFMYDNHESTVTTGDDPLSTWNRDI